MKGTLLSTSVGCNRVVGCLDWGFNNLVAFGAHHFISIYDTTVGQIVGILNGHEGEIRCVKWFPTQHQSLLGWLVSGSADHSLRIWSWRDSQGKPESILRDFDSGVSCLAVNVEESNLQLPSITIAGCCADPGIFIFRNKHSEDNTPPLADCQWKLIQKLSTDASIQLSLAISPLPANPQNLLLASGGSDSRIRLFVRLEDGLFTSMCILSGHENWIRGLDFTSANSDSNKLLLASASQDRFARVWSITPTNNSTAKKKLSFLAPSVNFRFSEGEYGVRLEGLLTGHEDWVHTVQFSRSQEEGVELLTASMDRTMIFWKWESAHEWWIQKDSVGDAGSTSLGYFGGVYSPLGDSILSHGFTGALHLWTRDHEGNWIPKSAMTGHYDEVVGLSFAIEKQAKDFSSSSCLLSVGKDQTTRISTVVDGHWHEIARPQVHGHDFYSVAYIPGSMPYTFASCSEEKVVRVFEAPSTFHQYLELHNIIPRSTDSSSVPEDKHQKKVAYGATIKALALTNTALYEGESTLGVEEDVQVEGIVGQYTPGPDFAPNASPQAIKGAPLEEHLSQNTLWPETQKLYGHGDVVYCLAASPCGQYLASACKAQREDVAVIFMWNTKSWTSTQQLKGHSLTVTKMEFSPSGKYLLTGGRDRTFCVFEKKQDGFELMQRKTKAHGRIIWDISWSPNEALFATGSRDQSIKFWKMPDCSLIHTLPFKTPVLSVCFQPTLLCTSGQDFRIAVGLNNGGVEVWCVSKLHRDSVEVQCEQLWCTNKHSQHSAAVNKVCWSTSKALLRDQSSSALMLASCSADHSIRVFQIEDA